MEIKTRHVHAKVLVNNDANEDMTVCAKYANMRKNNQEFWRKKLEGNKVRNRFVARELRKMG